MAVGREREQFKDASGAIHRILPPTAKTYLKPIHFIGRQSTEHPGSPDSSLPMSLQLKGT
jgi:hypothetical protein